MHISPQEYLLYLQYLGLAIVLEAVFAAAYLHSTPNAELRLTREGNTACALSFGGALIGFSLPLAASIRQSVRLVDFILWGVVAAVIQIALSHIATRLIIRNASRELANNNTAAGTLLAALSISIGLLNAACLS